MKFELECTLVLSKKISGLDLEEIKKRVKPLLSKGAPEGKCGVLDSIKLDGDKLYLKLSSGAYVRPHDAVFRIKNFFAKEFGQKHKTGVREIVGRKYRIEFDLENELSSNVKIPFSKLEVKNKKHVLVLENLSEEFLKGNVVDRIVKLVKEKSEKQQYGEREEHHTVIYESNKNKASYDKNPTEEMLARKWIKRTPHRNQFIFGPELTELSEALKKAMVDVVYKPLGFSGMIFPKIVDWSIWKKSGHARALYHGGFNPYFFSTPKTADPDAWEEVSDLIKVTGEIPGDKIKDLLDPPKGGLAFAQCPPFWTFVEGETIASESLPIKVYDWSGPTYRYESGGAHGFERVDELHRIETLWLGTQEQVRDVTAKLRDKLRTLIEDVLELELREAHVTPWFMEQAGLVDETDDEKMIVGTIDFETYLPYNDSWLETQNCSNNGDKYPKAFNVKGQKEELWSGCAGGSFERYLSAFLAQKGFEFDGWPKKFRKYVESLPEGPKFL